MLTCSVYPEMGEEMTNETRLSAGWGSAEGMLRGGLGHPETGTKSETDSQSPYLASFS